MGKVFTMICIIIFVIAYQKIEINVFETPIKLNAMNLIIFLLSAISIGFIIFVIKERHKRL